MSVNYQTIKKFEIESGYTENAIRKKINNGVWAENQVWVKAPDGRQLISVEGYNLWVESMMGLEKRPKAQLKLTSITVANDAKSGSNSSPPPLI